MLENTVDTSKVGEYKVIYKVSDSDGASTACEVLITVNQEPPISPLPPTYFKVTFYDMNGNIISTKNIAENTSTTPISAPSIEDFKFIGWFTSPTSVNEVDFKNILRDIKAYARYEVENVPVEPDVPVEPI